jgi:hypothetical protein
MIILKILFLSGPQPGHDCTQMNKIWSKYVATDVPFWGLMAPKGSEKQQFNKKSVNLVFFMQHHW